MYELLKKYIEQHIEDMQKDYEAGFITCYYIGKLKIICSVDDPILFYFNKKQVYIDRKDMKSLYKIVKKQDKKLKKLAEEAQEKREQQQNSVIAKDLEKELNLEEDVPLGFWDRIDYWGLKFTGSKILTQFERKEKTLQNKILSLEKEIAWANKSLDELRKCYEISVARCSKLEVENKFIKRALEKKDV